MAEDLSRRKRPHRARSISSISARLTILVVFSSALPLAFVGGLSIMLTRYSFERTALSQIVDALERAHSIVAEYHSLVELGVMNEQRALSFIRRLFLGDLVEVSIRAENAEDAESWFAGQAAFRPAGAPAPYGLPNRFPVEMDGDRAVMRDFLAVLSFKQAMDSLPLDMQAGLVNGPRSMRLKFNLKTAAVRIQESGYVFAISGSEKGTSEPVYELFHPTLTMVDVAQITNSHGEQVGLMISQRQGTLVQGLPPGYLRYEYDWVN